VKKTPPAKKKRKTETKTDDESSDGERALRQQTQRRTDSGRVCGVADRGSRSRAELPIGVTHGNRRRRLQCGRHPGAKPTGQLPCDGRGVVVVVVVVDLIVVV